MNARQPSLIEVLYPRSFPSDPRRTKATRTVLQPEIDRFEQAEGVAKAGYRLDGALTRSGSCPSCIAGGAA